MAFICPQCPKGGTLELVAALELPPEGPWDEMTLQLATCQKCRARVVAFYRESRGGSLASESCFHRGMRIAHSDFDALKRLIAQCPTPQGARCPCSTHTQVQQDVQGGRWRGIDDATSATGFAMELPQR